MRFLYICALFLFCTVDIQAMREDSFDDSNQYIAGGSGYLFKALEYFEEAYKLSQNIEDPDIKTSISFKIHSLEIQLRKKQDLPKLYLKAEALYENSGEILADCGNTALMAKIGRCLLHAFEMIGKELDITPYSDISLPE